MVADRARCPVWELEDAPSWWVERVYVAALAENAAESERRIREARRQRAAGARR